MTYRSHKIKVCHPCEDPEEALIAKLSRQDRQIKRTDAFWLKVAAREPVSPQLKRFYEQVFGKFEDRKHNPEETPLRSGMGRAWRFLWQAILWCLAAFGFLVFIALAACEVKF